jgi:hypothetical protein
MLALAACNLDATKGLPISLELSDQIALGFIPAAE